MTWDRIGKDEFRAIIERVLMAAAMAHRALSKSIWGRLAPWRRCSLSGPHLLPCCGEPCNDALDANLVFNFHCSEGAEPPDERIERFLHARGFRTLNKLRLAREQHVAFPYTLSIVALVAQRQEVTFLGFPHTPRQYSVILNSPPPARHDVAFEDALTAFVVDQLQCEVRQVSHGENSAEAGPFYDRVFKQADGWFKQADVTGQLKP